MLSDVDQHMPLQSLGIVCRGVSIICAGVCETADALEHSEIEHAHMNTTKRDRLTGNVLLVISTTDFFYSKTHYSCSYS